jgi:hypothetical protein
MTKVVPPSTVAADWGISLTVTTAQLAALSRGEAVTLYVTEEDIPAATRGTMPLPELEVSLRLGREEDPHCE